MASGTALFDHVKALCASDEFTDVVLVARSADGNLKDLPSHLCIIARSPVFKRMFSGAFAEGASKRVEIPVTKARHLELIREFLYTDKMEFATDWTTMDGVELMALCDKYEVTLASTLVLENLVQQLRNLSLDDAEQIVDQLSAAVGQQALVQEVLSEVVSKVQDGSQIMQFLVWLQQLHRRSGLRIHEALDKVVPKAEFGGQVMQVLVWLQQLHRCSGLTVQPQLEVCLQRVHADQAALEHEFAVDHGSADDMDVMRARMLVTTQFLERASTSLQTTSYATGSKRCLARNCSQHVSVGVWAEINTIEKPMLSFGLGRLMEDMKVMFVQQNQQSGNSDSTSAKKQKIRDET